MRVREWKSNDYHDFWKSSSRRYIDRVERIILKNLIYKGKRIVDVGGGYGRLIDLYQSKFEQVVIVDHSLSMLEDLNRRIQKKRWKNVLLVAANVYKMPFADRIFDQALMIRVLHHLENPREAVRSINQVLKDKGIFVLEYQNLLNINNRIKNAFLSKKINLTSLKPYKISDMYWNFHPIFINSCIKSLFEIGNILGGGIFWGRNALVKLLLYPEIVDKILMRFFGRYSITHQIFLELKNRNHFETINRKDIKQPIDMFVCCNCSNTDLIDMGSDIVCKKCKMIFPIHNGIYDFRML